MTFLRKKLKFEGLRGKLLLILFFSVIPFAPSPTVSGASWLIDEAVFHHSAHGQTSCQDCHDDITERALHPDPANVSKTTTAFFKMEQCLSCHDDIEEQLHQGFHGEEKIGDSQDYRRCLACHEPHSQMRLDKDENGRFDPSKPVREQCDACHEKQERLPPLSDEDRACMQCHRRPGDGDPDPGDQIDPFCFQCHGQGETEAQKMTAERVSLLDSDIYEEDPHAPLGCMACHPDAARFGHGDQERTPCGQCHFRHDEKVAHDAHMGVSCEDCHLGGIQVVSDPATSLLSWTQGEGVKKGDDPHQWVPVGDESSCRRCHFKGNQFAAASMILPPKTVLCMPCHASTFTIAETTTILSLCLFLIGLLLFFSYALSGSVLMSEGKGTMGRFGCLIKGVKAIPAVPWGAVIRALVLDVLLQRRLYRQSILRWAIHGLIFFPFMCRFLWGMAGLIGSLWTPASPMVWVLLDKNHPATALIFDLTGAMILLGVILSLIRGFGMKAKRVPGLPERDPWALVLVAGIVIIGFLLEGTRIAMTGNPPGSAFAFIGHVVSILFTGSTGLTAVYGPVWYAHAVLTGIFIAYLPFSRLFHVILSPLVLLLNAMSGHKRG